jgi:hypothetical protein
MIKEWSRRIFLQKKKPKFDETEPLYLHKIKLQTFSKIKPVDHKIKILFKQCENKKLEAKTNR